MKRGSLFNVFPVRKPKGNLFDLSHERKFSFNMGQLVPMYVQDVVPGDRFKVRSEVLLRLAPMLAPVMHRVNVFVHFFFVPNRLVWDHWEDFITGGKDGTAKPSFPTEKIVNTNKTSFGSGSLADYLGVPDPTGITVHYDGFLINKMPFRAYQMIYNEYYRDPNLEDEVVVRTDGGYGAESPIRVLRTRCWEKDYFTSCLPWSQRGGDVNLPVTGEINFVPVVKSPATADLTSGGVPAAGDIQLMSGGVLDSTGAPIDLNTIESEDYDLTNVGITINDVRTSIKLQEWLEKNARGGGRYIEQVLSHFGVKSSDARLQRPEYLGGGKSPVVISEVLAASETGTTVDVGDMYGHGISVGNTNSFNRFFEEHGYILGIISVMPRTAYQQGLERHWTKFDKFDYYFPEFANLGEQEVKNKEIYLDYTLTEDPEDTFGYQSRYAEYKYKQDSVHGDFRKSLAYWHMGRIFSAAPKLNESFVHLSSDDAGVHRIHTVTTPTIHKLYCQLYNSVKAIRPMPKFGIPIL